MRSSGGGIARARELAARGRFRPAVEILKELIRTDPEASAPRLALAQLYRDARYPDQAGRWGILEPGWTTPVERDRFVRTVTNQTVDLGALAHYLLLPDASAIPETLIELINRPLGPRIPLSEQSPRAPRPGVRARRLFDPMANGWSILSRVLLAMTGAISTFLLVVVFSAAFVGAEDARTMARVGGIVIVLMVSFTALSIAISCLTQRKWLRAAIAILVFAASAVLFALWASSPDAPLA